MAKALMIISPKNFRDEEFFDTKSVLEAKKIKVYVASYGVKEATGVLGGKAKVSKEITAVNVHDYDAIIFVGGKGSHQFFDDDTVQEIAREAYNSGKVIAAICAAPTILANAELLRGRRVTSFPGQKQNIEGMCGEYIETEDVVIDGSIITANGPKAAKKFGEAIAEAIL